MIITFEEMQQRLIDAEIERLESEKMNEFLWAQSLADESWGDR